MPIRFLSSPGTRAHPAGNQLQHSLEFLGVVGTNFLHELAIKLDSQLVGPPVDLQSLVGNEHKHSPVVGRVKRPVYDSGRNKAVDHLGERRMIHEDRLGEISHGAPILIAQDLENTPMFDLDAFAFQQLSESQMHAAVRLGKRIGDVVLDLVLHFATRTGSAPGRGVPAVHMQNSVGSRHWKARDQRSATRWMRCAMLGFAVRRRQKAGAPQGHRTGAPAALRHTIRDAGHYRVGLLVPMCGSAGIWGPSCIASAETAAAELNATRGIGGREVELILIDSAVESSAGLALQIHRMIEADEINAIVGMHISAVRQRLAGTVAGRIPYVYTPLYEGGEKTPGVFAIGETPESQLIPAIRNVSRRHGTRNWALIGNDYIWPRTSSRYARECIRNLGGSVVLDRYLEFGSVCPEEILDELATSGAEGVVLSLVGQDAVEFNRAFGYLDLDRRMIRLSCAIEENGLLAIGSANSKRLYASASYFGVLDSDANHRFKQRYRKQHGSRAPTLNAIGQSLYEGLHFLAALEAPDSCGRRQFGRHRDGGIRYRSARGSVYYDNRTRRQAMFLARADGMVFQILERL